TRRAVQRSLEGRGDFEADYRLVAPGVDTRWLAARGRCEFDRDGKPLRLHGVTIDITKRRQAEEALLASEQRVSPRGRCRKSALLGARPRNRSNVGHANRPEHAGLVAFAAAHFRTVHGEGSSRCLRASATIGATVASGS